MALMNCITYRAKRQALQTTRISEIDQREIIKKPVPIHNIGEIQAFIHQLYTPWRRDPPSPLSVKSVRIAYRLSIC